MARGTFLRGALLATLAASVPARVRSADALGFRDVSLPVAARVDDLIARLTLDEKVSQLTDASAAIDRLGIPAYHWWNEALHGVARAGVATVFPQAIGMAATWNAPLIEQIGTVVGTEGRASIKRFGQAAQHIADAQAAGQPSIVTINKSGAKANRSASLKGLPTVPGLERDEWPLAMFGEGVREQVCDI